ncbi:MAG TPA: hypothetical protein VEF03_12245 [Candidatus Binataceae bacterium]|nr:hypothetical protein [Candidatus Binataceae bacterium]
MRLRHAVVISMAGWLLMMPPTNPEHPLGAIEAPLAQWKKSQTTYRTKEECEHVLDRLTRLKNGKNKQVSVRYYKQAQCISSADPRLKEK